MKNLYILLICGLISAATVSAQTWNCGASGNNVIATLSGGTLTISGTGAMRDYSSSSRPPWYNSRASITSVNITGSVTNIGNSAFDNHTLLTSVIIPDGVTDIGEYAFAQSGLTSVTVPGSVTNIGSAAFIGNERLNSVTILDGVTGVTSIGNDAFALCSSLSKLTMGNTVETIGSYAFKACNIYFVNIPDGVISIGDNAFNSFDTDGITQLVIPASVKEIGVQAFAGNNRLKDISVSWDIPIELNVDPLYVDPFSGITKGSVVLHVPVGTKEAYKAVDVWKNFNIVDDGKILVNDQAFLENLTVSAGILSPAFSPDRRTYRVTVPLWVEHITLTGTPMDDANVTGDGQKALNTGENTFEITASTSDAIRVYTVVVTRTTNEYSVDFVSYTEITTGALTAVFSGFTTPLIDRHEFVYELTTRNFSGDLTLNFSLAGNNQSRTVSVEANSIYRLTLSWQVGYAQTGDISATTHMDQYGRPSHVTLIYTRRLRNVVVSNNEDDVISSHSEYITGSFYTNMTVSSLIFMGNGDFTIYTVTFDSQSGSEVPSQTIVDGDKVTQPATNPSRDGYTFGGWYKETTCTNAWNFTTDVVNSNITLYAKWTAVGPTTYAVTFDSQGGSAVFPQTIEQGGKVIQPGTPTREGHTFGGWYKESACATAWNFDTDVVNSNITLFAKWTKTPVTGMDDVFAPDLKIYPNPFTGEVHVAGVVETGRAPSLQVINAVGVTVHTQTITNPEETIRLDHLPAGVYFFQLEMDRKSKTVKVIKIQ